uniref:Uncharacterized protein n=1 Tax=Aegilops tauschii subsp. strangulata TaxID=200361 RepID=A0A453R499_AEGTS
KKTRPQEEHGLASSPSRPLSHRRRHHHARRPLPATSGAVQHAPELPTVRASLPSGHILRSHPLPPARNPTTMARVSGRASPEPRARQQRRWLGATTVNAGAHRVAQAPQLLPPVAPLHGYILFPSDYKHGLCAVGRNLFVINQRQCERLLKTL